MSTCVAFINEPRAYREVLAAAVNHLRPHVAVVESSPATLNGQLPAWKPQLVVCSDLTPEVRAHATAWIVLYPREEPHAEVSVDGRESRIDDVAFTDVLAVIDQVCPNRQG